MSPVFFFLFLFSGVFGGNNTPSSPAHASYWSNCSEIQRSKAGADRTTSHCFLHSQHPSSSKSKPRQHYAPEGSAQSRYAS